MKSEILRILQMQADGKLTQDQAAELLAILADQAREKESTAGSTQGTDAAGAPGPQARANGSSEEHGGTWSATATLHDFVDKAVDIGTTVGRAATVWGGEFVNMVHREQEGNTITISKVESPTGVDFTFRENVFNVSKVSHLALNHAEFTHNTLNASKLAQVAVTHGRFAQCQLSGSSVNQVTLEGMPAAPTDPAAAAPEAAGAALTSALRGATFNATKFARVRLLAGSQVDACTFQAAAVKDLELAAASSIRDSRFNDAALTTTRLERSTWRGVAIERSAVQSLTTRDSTLERVTISGTRISDATISGGTWTNTRFGRSPAAGGVGSRESLLQETRFENCTLTDCEFLGCTFRRTTLRNLTLSGVTVRNIDFTGLTIESEEAFRKAAGV